MVRQLFAGCFLVAVASLVLTPSSQDLHNRYGEPDMERFIARPGIGLTVEYGSDGHACQMVIEAQKMLIEKEQPPKGMSPDIVSGILDEVTPVSVRGNEIGHAVESMGCSEVRIAEYENVWISQSIDRCLPLTSGQEKSVRIIFKRGT